MLKPTAKRAFISQTWIKHVKKLAVLAVISTGSSCVDEPKYWTFALEDSPENLTIAIWTVGLRETPTSEITVTADQAKRDVEKASDIWEDNCGIRFVHAGHSEILTEEMGLSYLPKEPQDSRDVAAAIVTPTDIPPEFIMVGYVTQVLSDYYGEPSGVAGAAYYRAILISKPYAPYPRPWLYYFPPQKNTVLAHELGHLFGLEHVNEDEWEEETLADEQSNVMHPFTGWGRALHPFQCERAKRYMLGWGDYQELCRPYAHADVSLDSDEEVDFTCGYRPDFDADSSP